MADIEVIYSELQSIDRLFGCSRTGPRIILIHTHTHSNSYSFILIHTHTHTHAHRWRIYASRIWNSITSIPNGTGIDKKSQGFCWKEVVEWCCLTWPGQNGGRLQGCTVLITNRDDKKKFDQRITWQGTSPHMVVHVGTRNSPEMSIRFQVNEICPL